MPPYIRTPQENEKRIQTHSNTCATVASPTSHHPSQHLCDELQYAREEIERSRNLLAVSETQRRLLVDRAGQVPPVSAELDALQKDNDSLKFELQCMHVDYQGVHRQLRDAKVEAEAERVHNAARRRRERAMTMMMATLIIVVVVLFVARRCFSAHAHHHGRQSTTTTTTIVDLDRSVLSDVMQRWKPVFERK